MRPCFSTEISGEDSERQDATNGLTGGVEISDAEDLVADSLEIAEFVTHDDCEHTRGHGLLPGEERFADRLRNPALAVRDQDDIRDSTRVNAV